ncbi:hypothetical protein BH10BAC5_BH10BAC5_20410 [soil metagenome]
MSNQTNNIQEIIKIAKALQEINERTLFVGGTVVSIYADDPAADDVRPTKDVDITLQILTVGELEQLRQDLISKGFEQSAEESVICRFLYNGTKVDVMSTKEIDWAPSDKWFDPGFKRSQKINDGDIEIRILPLPYFLASKFNAFHERGLSDPRTSHDFEDITYILDNRIDLAESILSSPIDVKIFIQSEFKKILEQDNLKEAIIGNLYFATQDERLHLIFDKLNKVVDGR